MRVALSPRKVTYSKLLYVRGQYKYKSRDDRAEFSHAPSARDPTDSVRPACVAVENTSRCENPSRSVPRFVFVRDRVGDRLWFSLTHLTLFVAHALCHASRLIIQQPKYFHAIDI